MSSVAEMAPSYEDTKDGDVTDVEIGSATKEENVIDAVEKGDFNTATDEKARKTAPTNEVDSNTNDGISMDVGTNELVKAGGYQEGMSQEWPTLFDEGLDALYASNFIYVLSDLRKLVKNKGSEASNWSEPIQKLLRMPCTYIDIADVYKNHLDDLQKAGLIGCEKQMELYYSQVTAEQEVVFLEDETNSDGNCVYGIGVQHTKKRISLVFRGTTNVDNWIHDAENVMTPIHNPVQSMDDDKQPSQISIQLGYKKYMYGSAAEYVTVAHVLKGDVAKVTSPDNYTSRYKQILAYVVSLCEKYPSYRFYVTGHSLGGALATLFALEVAAFHDERIAKPVTLITIAAPKSGNMHYCAALEALEKRKLLRFLRIYNERDSVPKMPGVSLCHILDIIFYPTVLFWHAGVGLSLTTDKRLTSYCQPGHRIHLPLSAKRRSGFCRMTLVDLHDMFFYSCMAMCICAFVNLFTFNYFGLNALEEHSCIEYIRRLQREKEKLCQLYLNDIYNMKFKQQIYPKNSSCAYSMG